MADIPEGDWYCCLCLPIIHEQYDPSLVWESDFEDDQNPNLNSHSDNDSSVINVVDSDSNDSGMDWRPSRKLVVIKESSESTNQDSDDNSSYDGDAFHRWRASSKVTISTSTEGSDLESEPDSDIDVVSIGESSDSSHSHSKKRMELGDQDQSSDGSEEAESDFDEAVQPAGEYMLNPLDVWDHRWDL